MNLIYFCTMTNSISEQIIGLGFFRDPAMVEELTKHARSRTFHKDDILMDIDQEIRFIPIVLEGCIRIIREDEDGNEAFLYHLYPGQTCAMSLTCCQAGKKSMIKAIAEDQTSILQIPVEVTSEWYQFTEWKVYISSNYHNRFAELLQVIDLIAFNNMDVQLHHYLKERCKAHQSNMLETTHQQIADELHTHREVISRLLRAMELKKLVRLGRNSIELLDF